MEESWWEWTDGGEKARFSEMFGGLFKYQRIHFITLIHVWIRCTQNHENDNGCKEKYCSKKYLPPTKFVNDTTQSYASHYETMIFPSLGRRIHYYQIIDVLSDIDFEGWSPNQRIQKGS